MSIIQTIRDRAAVIMIVIIAVSLIAFILQDAFSGRGGMGSQSTTIGKVNGREVDYVEFQKMVEAQEAQYAQSGMPVNESTRQTIRENVWNQFIGEELLTAETKELGMQVSPKELNDMFFGDNPPQDLRQQFTNPETGQFDGEALKAAIRNLKSQKNTPQAKQFAEQYIPAIGKSRLQEKYFSLVSSASYVPKWMIDKMASDNSAIANISFVNVPYATVSDSTVKVSDDDINKYVSAHKEQYKQEKTRSIVYVAFDAAPSGKDTAETLAQIQQLKEEFTTTPETEQFLNRVGTESPFFDGYVLKSKLQVVNADTIRSLAPGQVYGPYLDGGNFVYAKMLSSRSIPDSVKCRHILISTQTGLPDSTAKTRIDSIAGAIKSGADFKALAEKYSDDPGSKSNGGEYEFSSLNFASLAKEFAETVFYGAAGDKKVVKTQFGYHYIEVMSQKNFETAYKIAYLAKPILASNETETTASNAATQFAGDARSLSSFKDNVKKQALQEFVAADIKENDFAIPGVGSSRELVQKVFGADKGDVLEPVNVGDKYVVAAVTEVNAEGTMSAAKARPLVEIFVRNEKKAEEIRKKLGNAATLEAIAGASGTQVLRADSVSFASTFVQGAGSEPKLVGMAFNKANLNKVSPLINGTSGVFAVKTESIGAKGNDAMNPQQMKESAQMQMKQFGGRSALEGLRKSATIKDNRSKFF
ncbi:SurA N-terminal domain-containing protein [Parasegetibacter sp. NRK P23]|uniref:peptidylprolyl isomerase n=1 Tax=Parasegetibacter sp. NRK P23 TaxID=2942999 RepID=UPI0020438216|nr:SurA N-terminal domain-containing protein [Parasegetibacter sp. NRK P23]MCM5529892.1 SurA N-terminal domain-containing protein [Parasegetibacter sp. NRK P23]